jgi:hypothetical protein
MPYFKIMLSGDGISIPLEGGGDPIIGFFTTRVVRAEATEAAVTKAKKLVISEWKEGAYAAANMANVPSLNTETAVRVGYLTGIFSKPKGYTFFTVND